MTRILIAGILGGVAMFIWSWVAHDVLPLGEIGVREIQTEQPVLDTLKANLTDDGLYMYPGGGHPKNATRQEKEAAMKAVMAKAASGPSGLILYHPTRQVSFGKLLGVEFVTELLEALLVVCLLAQTRIDSFVGRVGFVLFAGIIAAIATNVPYWNWYSFPTDYTMSYIFMQVIGFLCVGIVAALVLGRNQRA
jgi:hypothetical protein